MEGPDWMSSAGSRSPECRWAAGGRTAKRKNACTLYDYNTNLFDLFHVSNERTSACGGVLTGRISKVCRAPVFRVMVSLSLAAAAESDANTKTTKSSTVRSRTISTESVSAAVTQEKL